jgi:hypothetical protein
MNRKRKSNESYKKYKENLKKEAFLLKIYLRGRIFWQSSVRGQYTRGDKV